MNYKLAPGVAYCIGCGCQDHHACENGCWWLRVDYEVASGVCSECEKHVNRWDAGERWRNTQAPADIAGQNIAHVVQERIAGRLDGEQFQQTLQALNGMSKEE